VDSSTIPFDAELDVDFELVAQAVAIAAMHSTVRTTFSLAAASIILAIGSP